MQRRTQRINVRIPQILVEISALRRQHHRLDPGRLRPVEQSCHRAIARPIVVTDDIESPKVPGELFFYVNDAVTPIPGWQYFYGDNRGCISFFVKPPVEEKK
jgi:hypothetical protein